MPKLSKKIEIPVRSLATNGYYSVLSRKELLYGVLIRSPAASGKIKSFSCPDLPEGYFIYGPNDIPGKKFFECNESKIKVFGYDNVAYNGEPLGILIGPDEFTLRQLLKNISFNFDIESLESAVQQVITKKKRPVIDLTEKNQDITDFADLINDLPSLDTVIDKTHIEENPNKQIANRIITSGLYKTQNIQDADKTLFTEDDFIISKKYNQKLISPKWYETDGAYCYCESGILNVYTPTKWTYNLQQSLCEVLDVSPEKINIHRTKTSGIYPNGLWRTNQIAIQVALASYLSKKTIKLILTPEEQEIFMVPGVKTDIKYQASVTKEGKIKALKADINIDVGSENPFSQEITDRMAIAVSNFYKIENLYISATAHISKNPPTTIHQKCVDSQIFFAIENLIQSISSTTNLFPAEIREINSIPQKNIDYPINIDLIDVNETIKHVIKFSDFNRKYAAYQMDAIDRIDPESRPFFALPLRGIGLASAYNTSGYCGESSFSNDSKIEITLTTENKVIIHAIKPSDVIQAIWKQTASEILQIPIQNIHINSDYAITEIPKSPEDTFSTIGILNELVKKCCQEIQRKRFRQALPITSKKNLSAVLKKNWNQQDFTGSPFQTTSCATSVVEVELDNYTFSQKIKGIWIEISCGELYDEQAALKTVKLEVQQELATLVQGKAIPYENLHISFNKTNKKPGQIGELVHNTLPAAFSSAMALALATEISQLPITEKQIFNLVKNRTARGIKK